MHNKWLAGRKELQGHSVHEINQTGMSAPAGIRCAVCACTGVTCQHKNTLLEFACRVLLGSSTAVPSTHPALLSQRQSNMYQSQRRHNMSARTHVSSGSRVSRQSAQTPAQAHTNITLRLTGGCQPTNTCQRLRLRSAAVSCGVFAPRPA